MRPQNERVWRILTNLWTVIVLGFIVVNFAEKNRYEPLVAPVNALYAGLLTLYVGTKEFDRWYERHAGRHPGELFVIFWTALMVSLVIANIVLGPAYLIPSDVVATYIAVLTLFALTQQSKKLYRARRRR